MTWNKNMDDAPRDGTRVILAYPNFVTEAAYGEYRYRGDTYTGWFFHDSEDSWYSVGFHDFEDPRAWQPLPQPPEVEG